MSKEVKRYVATRTLPAASEWNSSTVPHTYVRAADYDALLAERDRLRSALERFYNANQARLKLLSREAYLDMQRLPGMRDALYEMDDAQHQAFAALQGAQS